MSGYAAIEGWLLPSDDDLCALLEKIRTVAIVGVSADLSQPSSVVASYLLGTDCEVYFVNPKVDEILGRRCMPTLGDLPVVPDCVNVFRRLDDVPELAEQAVAVGAQIFWTQFDLWSPQAARIVLDAGMDLVMDRCLKIEHARSLKVLRPVGAGTRAVEARRPCR